MSLTLIVTRDVPSRYRGFLASILVEVAAGVYISPRLNKDTRERVWDTLAKWWHNPLSRGSIVMVWRQRGAVGGLGVAHMGEPPKALVEIDGLLLTRRPLPPT